MSKGWPSQLPDMPICTGLMSKGNTAVLPIASTSWPRRTTRLRQESHTFAGSAGERKTISAPKLGQATPSMPGLFHPAEQFRLLGVEFRLADRAGGQQLVEIADQH